MAHRIQRLAYTTAAIAIFLIGVSPCCAQSANKIIDQFVRSSGGAKRIATIHSAAWQGTVKEVNKNTGGEFTLITQVPGEYYREIVFGADQIAEACDESSCWGEEGAGNLYTLFGAEEKRAEATGRDLNFALANYKKLKIHSRLMGVDMLNGRPVDVVEVMIPPGAPRRVWFDQQTHLIVKEIIEAAEKSNGEAQPADHTFKIATSSSIGAPEEITYGDYRPVQGVMEPFSQTIQQGGRAFQVSIDHITLNGKVNTSAFAFPNRSNKSLPDIAALLSAVDKNQKHIDEIQKDYACMKREEVDRVNGKGEVTKHTTTVYQISYIQGNEVARKIEVDGKPLSAEEQQKEDARLKQEADKYEKEAAQPPKKDKEDNDDVTISDFLRTSRFTNPRWERFRGQDVVVFDFGPNPDYEPKRLAERLIYDLVGTVWVDPQAQDIARLEARMKTSFKIGGGILASLQKDSAFQFEQSLVNGQVYLPSYDEVHFGAKVLMLKTVRADVVDHYYDYQKFSVSAQQKIGQPKKP